MHELGIADSILTTIRKEVARHPDARFVAVGIQIGELSGVNPDALAFGFESLVKGTDLESLELRIDNLPLRHHCPSCDLDFDVVDFATVCPKCGERKTRFIGGDEINISYLELEE